MFKKKKSLVKVEKLRNKKAVLALCIGVLREFEKMDCCFFEGGQELVYSLPVKTRNRK